jgi:hypothetical protein
MKIKLYIDDIPDPSFLPKFEELGVEQYSILYQFDVNDRESTDGTVDVKQIMNFVDQPGYVDGGAPFATAKTVFLDFEEPHTWVLMTGNEYNKKHPNGTVVNHENVSKNMVDAINHLKKQYPDKRWGYYGTPNLPIWMCVDGGDIISHETCTKQIRVYDASEKQLQEFKEALYESYKDVAEASDMVSAVLYQHDVADKDASNLDKIDPTKTKISIELLNRFDSANEKEKLAWISPILFKEFVADINGANSKVKGFETIPFDELLKDTIYPFLVNGGDGFIIWFGGSWRVYIVTSPLADRSNLARREEQILCRNHFNKQFLNGKGEPAESDKYWTSPEMKEKVKTIYSNFLLDFCKQILQK